MLIIIIRGSRITNLHKIMFLLVILCVVLLSPCILSSIENCTATKCLRCLPSVTPNCTVSQINQWLYNVYCEPPSNSSNCVERVVTDRKYCFVLVDRRNDNGQWKYQALDFSFLSRHTNCSNIDGNPVIPNCLHLYSEVTSVENIGLDVICRCYEDDCQKKINITFMVTGNISSASSSSLISLTSSIIVNDDKTPSVTTSSMSANDDRTLSVTTSSSSDHSTLIPQSPQTPLSIVSISTSIYGNDLPSNILRNNPNSLEGPLNSKYSTLLYVLISKI